MASLWHRRSLSPTSMIDNSFVRLFVCSHCELREAMSVDLTTGFISPPFACLSLNGGCKRAIVRVQWSLAHYKTVLLSFIEWSFLVSDSLKRQNTLSTFILQPFPPYISHDKLPLNEQPDNFPFFVSLKISLGHQYQFRNLHFQFPMENYTFFSPLC